MIESDEEQGRDLARLVVSRAGRLVTTGDAREPYRVIGPSGEVVGPVSVFLRDLLASGKSGSTLRSYSVDLLRWWRFLDAVGVAWDRASRAEARDFSCWIQLTAKQRLQTSRPRAARLSSKAPGAPNPVTGKPASGDGYAPSTVAHSETVLRRFYDFQRDCGTGPVLNPFPLDPSRRGRRPHAHHNPMDEWMPERTGRYRPTVPKRIPRAIPDGWFNKLFASLPSDRDRALVAFWISTGARASELLGMRQCDFLPGEQLISVVRKGTRAVQQLPASADAFVWHRLYQQELLRLGVPRGRRQPAWWTLRRPYRPLSYHGAHRMFERVNASLGADWTLHDLRHSAASSFMSGLPPHIAQVICGHKNIGTTIGYKAVYPAEAIEAHRAFIARRRATRPSEEYRTPTDQEWDAFLAHFEKRKVSVGTCARAFASPCVHEHACVRCSLLRPDPAQRGRLEEIRDNLHDRIAEAEREGWLGEIEGLKVSLAGTEDKLTQIDTALQRREQAVHLGMPAFPDIAGRSVPPAPEGTP